MRETLNIARDKSLFAPDNPSSNPLPRSVAWHNVGRLYRELSPDIARKIDELYAYRAGAFDNGATEIGTVVPKATPSLRRHAEYIGATMGRRFTVFTPDDLKRPIGEKADTLVVPYILAPDTQTAIHEMGQEAWGLPPAMVKKLKNKATLHRLVREAEIEGLETPEFEISSLNNIPEKSKKILKGAAEMYEKYGLTNTYKLGVVIRAAEADGGYGMALVFEQEDGSIVVTPDGKEEDKQTFRQNEWSKALDFAKYRMGLSTSNATDPKFIISRRIDIEDSPGMSLIIKNGYVESIGWNGQDIAEGTKSCVGTGRYHAEGPYLERFQEKHEEESAEIFEKFLRKTAADLHIPFETITGVINMDLMIPGPQESTLRARKGLPSGFYIAECNARWTNYTDAIMAALGFKGRIPSIREIQRTTREKVHTIDKKSLRGADAGVVRDIMFDLNEEAQWEGYDASGAYMRMPGTNYAGFLLTGNRNRAVEKIDFAIDLANGE